MITKITKIKNLGLVFSNYTWDPSLPIFKKFNLVYGWNGSGKTTLSRLFDYINEESLNNIEFEIEDGNGNKYKQGTKFPQKIRIFNQDYIQNNIKIIESKAKSISILLGEENKELIEKIEQLKKTLDGDPAVPERLGKVSVCAELAKDKTRKTIDRDSKFTEVAKIISAAVGIGTISVYRKPNAEKDFVSMSSKTVLSKEELSKYSLLSRQESLQEIDQLILPSLKFEYGGESFNIPSILTSINEQAKALFQKTVESEVVPRLASNEDISQWVEQGFELHKKHSSDVCEYCLQKISNTRAEQLMRCFNEADKKLKEDIELLIEKLRKIHPFVESLRIPDKARFYADLKDEYDTKGQNFESAKQQFLANIVKFAEELKSKKSKTTEVIILKSNPDFEDFVSRINEVNKIIATHNKTTSDFEKVKIDAIQKLRFHYLSTVFDDVKTLDSEILKLGENITLLESEISLIKEEVSRGMAQISSDHKACDVINNNLTTFLGHKELTFVPYTKNEIGDNKEGATGYHIMRGDKPAVYLSEGEKTAIAFIYFVVHLGAKDFNIKEGIIVVDDPISSLDSNSLYQAFSFLKNAVKDGEQVFIFTHSFDFLKLLMNWRGGHQESKKQTGYYMIKNNFPSDVRCAYIDKMDKELCDYESEYHYLFKLLKQLRDEQDDSIAKAYPISNIARKVWDTFLMFAVPNGKRTYQKMEELKTYGKDAQKLDAIYKFTNDQSHITGSGFDPSLVSEAKKVVNELFEMMEEISPDHFKIIDRVTN